MGREAFGHPMAEAQTAQAGFCEEDGIEVAVVDAAEARVHVSTKRLDAEVGAQRSNLVRASQARGAHGGAARQQAERRELLRHERIGWRFTWRKAGDHEARRQPRGKIFEAVHGEVRTTFEQRFLDLLHEETLAANLIKGAVLDAVALRDDLEFVDMQVRYNGLEGANERTTLGEGEGRTSRRESKGTHARRP